MKATGVSVFQLSYNAFLSAILFALANSLFNTSVAAVFLISKSVLVSRASSIFSKLISGNTKATTS